MAGGAGARDITVRRGADFAAAFALAVAAGLEVTPDAPQPVVLWGAYSRDRLIGIVSLDEKGALPVIGWIVVEEALRGSGVGGLLLAAVEREARDRGSGVLWATARAPGFFLAHGYELVAAGQERDVLLDGCRDCPQLGATCHPQAVRKAIAPDG
jgi:N-acetylglutamate synthase-like GNAT family acetyltransferase